MKLSFDFDQTLAYKSIQDFAEDCIKLGCEVWIVTSRTPHRDNEDLFKVANSLNIPEDRVVFTSWADKSDFFESNPDFIAHLDDDSIEIELINERTTVRGIDVFSDVEWKDKCLSLINKQV